MNTKMTTNSQLSTTEPKKKQKHKQIKQTTRIRTESQQCRSHGGSSVGKGRGGIGEQVHGISSINGR